jgi:hypothetical protein
MGLHRRQGLTGITGHGWKLGVGAGTALLAMGGTAQAATVTVDSDLNGGDGSLRAAIAELNNNNAPVVDRILFDSSLSGSTIYLDSHLAIDEPLTIEGPVDDPMYIEGDSDSQHFRIETPPGTPVTLRGLELSSGNSTSGDPHVAAVAGGSIYSNYADLTLDRVNVHHNRTYGGQTPGGAVFSGGPLTVQDSWIHDNDTLHNGSQGGAIAAFGETTTITGSTISDNTTSDENAGGGGLISSGNTVIRNSTFTGNQTLGRYSAGAGMYITGTLTTDSATITHNYVTGDDASGGGIQFHDGAGDFVNPVLRNTIVGDNTATTSGADLEIVDAGGLFHAAFSVVRVPSDSSGDVLAEDVPGSNVTNTLTLMLPLTDNGGPVPTRVPEPLSPAIDAGFTTLALDQRLGTRPFDDPLVANSAALGANATDVGAVEAQPAVAPTCDGASATTQVGTAVQLTLACRGLGPFEIAATSVPAHGQLTGLDPATGTVTYTPAPGFTGTDTFEYTGENDYGFSEPGVATVTVVPIPVGGTPPPAKPKPKKCKKAKKKKAKKRATPAKKKKCKKKKKRKS